MRRKQRTYSVRMDRVAIVLIVLLGILLLISLLFKSCSKSDTTIEDTSTTANSQQDEKVLNSLSSFEGAIERLGFVKRSYSVNDIHYGELILVNNEHEYIFDENKQADMVEVSTVKNEFYNTLSSTMMLKSSVIEPLNNMMKDFYSASSDGDMVISSAYRSMTDQDILYSQVLDNSLSENPAGFSDSHTAYSFNLAVLPQESSLMSFEDDDNSSWIVENCAKYGFIQRYPEDKKSITGISNPSYFRYVSLPHSMYMKENNLCLEEYISMLNNYKFGVKSLRYTYDEQEYMIYLFEASNSDTVEVYVPSDKEYTIFGNNVNGFIITVKL
ncbi:MAG: D-alanyl-D-alanine carboxypeptidase family protein [Ruminococcus sp.]|nr:D-alanyl-D-alanine carboxypeptidase family protein [Ruminococcus sp.]